MKIFLNFVDEKRLFRINMKSNYSVSLLKQYIIALAKRKNIPLDVDNIRIRHIEGKKSFIKNLLGSKASSVDLIDQLVQAMRENSLWGRYGL